jgi:tetratricopeptide (TPR) repeat protein
VAVALHWSGSLLASPADEFAKANQAYNEGHFQDAVTGYEQAVQGGAVHANVFYNSGNAWYRLGNFGKAILNYERALALEPRHPEADANLRLARDEARALEFRTSPVERYARMATTKQLTIAAAVSLWIALFLCAHGFFSPRRSIARNALISFALLLCAFSISGVCVLENSPRGDGLAVVSGKQTEARVATADNAKSILVLPPGSEIKILSERGGWIYAALPNEQRGWIPSAAAERVRL